MKTVLESNKRSLPNKSFGSDGWRRCLNSNLIQNQMNLKTKSLSRKILTKKKKILDCELVLEIDEDHPLVLEERLLSGWKCLVDWIECLKKGIKLLN